MKSRHQIDNVYFHPEIITDLAEIAQSMTETQFVEFYEYCYLRVIVDAKEEPFRPKTSLDFKLAGWNRLDFYSMKKPPRGMRPDYRFVYRYDGDYFSFYKLAVGLRNAKGINGDSVYFKAEQREKIDEVWQKE